MKGWTSWSCSEPVVTSAGYPVNPPVSNRPWWVLIYVVCFMCKTINSQLRRVLGGLCLDLTEGGVDMSPKRSKWLIFCKMNQEMRETERERRPVTHHAKEIRTVMEP